MEFAYILHINNDLSFIGRKSMEINEEASTRRNKCEVRLSQPMMFRERLS